jgi:hypothetical protein
MNSEQVANRELDVTKISIVFFKVRSQQIYGLSLPMPVADLEEPLSPLSHSSFSTNLFKMTQVKLQIGPLNATFFWIRLFVYSHTSNFSLPGGVHHYS